MIWEKSFYFSQKPLKIIPIDVFRLWVASRDLKTHFLTIWYFIKVFNTNRKSEILENLEFQNFRTDFYENIKIALVDGFHQNRCQNEANSLYFRGKKWNLKFHDFMIVLQEFEIRRDFRNFKKSWKLWNLLHLQIKKKIVFARVGTKPLGGELVLD